MSKNRYVIQTKKQRLYCFFLVMWVGMVWYNKVSRYVIKRTQLNRFIFWCIKNNLLTRYQLTYKLLLCIIYRASLYIKLYSKILSINWSICQDSIARFTYGKQAVSKHLSLQHCTALLRFAWVCHLPHMCWEFVIFLLQFNLVFNTHAIFNSVFFYANIVYQHSIVIWAYWWV